MFEQQRTQLTHWWYGLAERERLLLTLLTVFFVILFALLFVKKSAAYKADQNRVYTQKVSEYHWMQSKQHLLASSNDPGSTAAVRTLFKTVSSSLKEFNLDVKRVNPENDNTIRMDFDNVQFDLFWQWLVNLQQREGVYIKTINIDRQPTEGIVDVRVSVTRGV